MEGLIEWHPVDGNGLQVFCEPERSGRSTVVFGESDLDEAADRLAAGGLTPRSPAAWGSRPDLDARRPRRQPDRAGRLLIRASDGWSLNLLAGVRPGDDRGPDVMAR